MSPSDFLSLIGKTNKISIIFFVITCILLGYEFYLYRKDKKGNKKPSIPLFNTKGGKQQPLTVHPAKPMPTPPAPLRTVAQPPVIAQMAPPPAKHEALHMPPPGGPVGPGLKKPKKKASRKAKVAVGATAALAVLTIGIAWKLNQPSSQQAGLTQQNSRADERTVPILTISPASGSASISPTASVGSSSARTIPILSPIALKTLSPTPLPSGGAIDLNTLGNDPGTQEGLDNIATNSSQTASTSATAEDNTSSSSGTISQLPLTGGNESTLAAETTVVPTLPTSGTVQYSLGLLVIASVIVFASFIF